MQGVHRCSLFLLLHALLFGVAEAAIPPSNPHVGAVWVAYQSGALKIASANGSPLLALAGVKETRAVALDPVRSTLWVWAGKSLQAFGFAGEQHLALTAAAQAKEGAVLSVHPADGAVWYGREKDLWSVSPAGQALLHLGLQEKLVALAIEERSGLLWVATEHAVEARDAVSGARLRALDLHGCDGVSDLAVDASGRVWVAAKGALCGFSSSGVPQAHLPFPGLRHLAAGPAGLWAATEKDLRLLSPAGSLSPPSQPLTKDGGIKVLRADPASGEAWAASEREVVKVAADGRVLLRLPLSAPGHVVDLAAYADTIAPELEIVAPAAGSVVATATPSLRLRMTDVGSGADLASVAVRVDGAAASVSCSVDPIGAACSFAQALGEGPHTVDASIADLAGNRSASASTSFTVDTDAQPPNDPELPPDPSTVAPPLDRTVATDIAQATRFLYAGSNPIQRDVAPGAIDPVRAAVVRGRALRLDGSPLPKARVSILAHPEWGWTLSRADGAYDLAVSGGAPLVVDVSRDGFLPAQRRVAVPWRDYVRVDDAVLLARDATATTITLGSPELQVARGSAATDEDGTRRATILFPPGVTAERVAAGGTARSISALTVRATEYTIGPRGPKAMPGPLPPNVGYTYAVELSADELAPGEEVRFSAPVAFYVENFLGFPTGGQVPAGSYDRRSGSWQGEDNGRVVRVLGADPAGRAEIDIDGSGQPASEADLTDLGVSDAERLRLASLYSPGTTLWRVPMSHFTPWDLNWPYGPPFSAEPPPPDMDEGQDPNDRSRPDDPDFNPDPRQRPDPNEPRDPNNPNDPNDPANRDGREDEDRSPDDCGSIIECYNQILGEDVPLVGTGQALHYRSDRVPGRNASYFLKVRLTGATVPAGLKRIDLEISIAGQLIQKEFPPLPLQELSLTWDGLDAYGRPVQGKQRVTIRKSYVYPLVYKQPADFRQSWSAFAVADYEVRTTRLAGEFAIVRERQGPIDGMAKVLGGWDQREVGLGGWSLSSHHAFDPAGRELYLGTGERRSARQIGPVSFVAAGTGAAGYAGDGGRAVTAQLANPHDVAAGPDGSLYVADTENQVVRRVSRDGVITRIAGVPGEVCQVDPGNSLALQCGNGGPALAAHLFFPSGISVAGDGSVYVADTGDHCVRRIAGGRIDAVAGQCRGFDPDGNGKRHVQGVQEKLSTDCVAGCDAVEDLSLTAPQDVEVAPDGGFYVADSSARVVVYVGPRGLARIVAGPGIAEQPERGDGGPALEATLIAPQGVAIGRNGEIYVADALDQRVRRIDRDGTIRTVAGTGEPGLSGDGEIGTEAQLDTPVRVAVSRDGSLYVADRGNGRIRRVSESGILSSLMGTEDNFEPGRGGPAQGVRLGAAFGLAAAPDGSLYVTDGSLVYRTGTALKGFTGDETVIPSEDGAEVYVFDPVGRHLRTQSALTGAVLERFRYDAAGRLSEIENADGLVTRIEHDPQGNPAAIVSPFGQRTLLTVDAHGYLATITDPAGETVTLGHGPGGLLESFQDPRANASHFAYDALGRLTVDADAAGGSMSLERFRVFDDYGVFQQTAEGRSKGRMVSRFWNGDVLHTNTDSRSGTMTRVETPAGRARDIGPDGTVSEAVSGGDPVWGFVVPVEATRTTRTPSGLALSSATRATAGLADIEDPLSLTFRRIETTVNGRLFTADYDAVSRRATSTSAEGRRSFSLHDARGRVVSAGVTGMASAQVSYDPLGRPVAVAQGSGAGERRTLFAYDSGGFLARVTDPLGHALSLERDAAGRVLRQVLPDGRELRFAYDAAGNVTSVTPPGRPPHTFTFTPVDLTAGYAPPAAGLGRSATTYSYDRDRKVTSVVRPDGQAVSLTYETTGRLHTLAFSRGALTYSYPLSGSEQVRRIEAPEGVQLDYSYDGFLPLRTTWSGPVAGSVERVYDANFRVTELRVDGIGVPFAHDRDGLLTRAGTLSILRSPDNGLLTGTQAGAVSTAMTYDEFGEPATMAATLEGVPVYSTAYTRDPLGRIKEKQETLAGTASLFAYSYDEAGRLTEVKRDGASISSLAYDANSNRIRRTTPQGQVAATYDDQDRLLTFGDLTFTYTANGELASKSQNGHAVTYDYDELGNLRGVVLEDGTKVDYLIDGQNRRIGKKVNGALGQAFLYQSSLNPAAQLDGAGTLVARFVYGTRANTPDLILKGGRTYRVLTDHLGSPRLIIDSETGNVAQRLDYDEWGKVTLDTNPGFQPFGFAGGLYDPQTGLIRFGARDYDPEVGRWTAKDPILFSAEEPNLYGYVMEDPVNFLDPAGLAKQCPQVPLAPPGVNLDKNMKAAHKHTFPFDLFWFRDQVDYGGPWDYKTRGDQYQDFGNFHYGAVGTSAGIPETVLLRAAGRAHVQKHSPDGKGEPGSIFNPWGGTPPYGDDPRDQEWIKKGVEYCKCKSEQ